MESTQLFLNDHLVTINADLQTIKKLNEDDQFLADYVNRAAKMGQFNFLFTKDPSLRRIVVKRSATVLKPIWSKKGRPTDDDIAATVLLLNLRNSEKYSPRFKDGYTVRSKLWDEVAAEMRSAGYDVDGHRCAQKFLHLTQNCQKGPESGELYSEIRKVVGDKRSESEDDDEEWLPKSKRRRKGEEEDGEFLKRVIKRNSELKEERYKEICGLIRKKNELLEEKLKQNREIIGLLQKLVN